MLKVIGFTTVSIPSILHPTIPYNVVLLEDDLERKFPKKTLKQYNLGDVITTLEDI